MALTQEVAGQWRWAKVVSSLLHGKGQFLGGFKQCDLVRVKVYRSLEGWMNKAFGAG